MATADRKAVIKNADMSEEMQQDAIDCSNQALEKFNIEKDIAAFIKKEFDMKYNLDKYKDNGLINDMFDTAYKKWQH